MAQPPTQGDGAASTQAMTKDCVHSQDPHEAVMAQPPTQGDGSASTQAMTKDCVHSLDPHEAVKAQPPTQGDRAASTQAMTKPGMTQGDIAAHAESFMAALNTSESFKAAFRATFRVETDEAADFSDLSARVAMVEEHVRAILRRLHIFCTADVDDARVYPTPYTVDNWDSRPAGIVTRHQRTYRLGDEVAAAERTCAGFRPDNVLPLGKVCLKTKHERSPCREESPLGVCSSPGGFLGVCSPSVRDRRPEAARSTADKPTDAGYTALAQDSTAESPALEPVRCRLPTAALREAMPSSDGRASPVSTPVSGPVLPRPSTAGRTVTKPYRHENDRGVSVRPKSSGSQVERVHRRH